ncbi:dorsal-ventral patterning tolloid-like protein 1 [Haliotis rufescens]|uniref:dorsal-ventral patterning tolloid-like protein 1 n=1 Tax=Haliotis rufescens TaxID=6454 RepID=UPI00201F5C37|nr:dorsal-ventral patterning tolloid-like protein 1 [Haliotis rufescens]
MTSGNTFLFCLVLSFLQRFAGGSECSGNLTATTNDKTLTSPNYPKPYSSNLHCVWTITAAQSNHTVIIQISSSDIQASDDCNADSVTVYNGNAPIASQVLGTFCKTFTPKYQSGLNQALVVFKTDESIVKKGFRLTYRSVPQSECFPQRIADGIMPYYIVSPGYPNAYFNNLNCNWEILTLLDGIELDVVSSDVEGPYPACGHDVVTVYSEFRVPTDHQLGQFCGSTSNTTTFVTPTPGMTVNFTTNSAVVKRGFRLRYQSFSGTGPTTPPPPPLPCGNSSYTVATTSTKHFLISPGYPHGYSGRENCSYTIIGPPNTMIHVKVTDSSLSSGSLCEGVYVKAYDGDTLVTVWCSKQRPEFQTQNNELNLRFATDGSTPYKGFNLTYFATSDPYKCENQLVATRAIQLFSSPNFPLQYQNNEDCIWAISTSEKNIKLTVELLRLQGGTGCPYDYVAIYDGSTTSSLVIGRLCFMDTPTLTSSGSDVLVRFHSDDSLSFTGFQMSYTGGSYSICGDNNLIAPIFGASHIKSPRYPNNYPSYTDCVWVIHTVNEDFVITLGAQNSSIEYSNGCIKDYVEVFDGASTSSPSLGKFCGTQKPLYQSSGSYMTVKFHSNGVSNDKGFYILYSAYPSSSSSNIGVIAGGSVGGVVFLVGVVAGGCFFRRRRLRLMPQRLVEER